MEVSSFSGTVGGIENYILSLGKTYFYIQSVLYRSLTILFARSLGLFPSGTAHCLHPNTLENGTMSIFRDVIHGAHRGKKVNLNTVFIMRGNNGSV